ncbi:MAG: PAS domain-containing protein [Campylobacterota bacterium]|nr:PAS domain-containing protein [Campylobacterota bacterium]
MSEFFNTDTSPFEGQYPEGHPVRVYLEENLLIRSYIRELQSVDMEQNLEFFKELFDKLAKVEFHFARKENQLFPYLEKHGWTSPSQNMWAFHDQIREEIKRVYFTFKKDDLQAIVHAADIVFRSLEHIMQVEEGRLLPNAMQMLSEEEWKEFREGDEEIGWMFDIPPTPYPEAEYIHPSEDTKHRTLPFGIEDKMHYDEGYLTPEQVNSIFRILPVDITYVNENDQVVFYNRGDDRVFPRSAGIIGREVKFCHPPKSVDQVLRILEEFKAGTQDVAEFWIQFKGKFIHIQYFAVRDEDRTYRGVIEMSQDVTHIRSLEGQQRLLDWD